MEDFRPVSRPTFATSGAVHITHGAPGVLACAVVARPDFVHSFAGFARCLKTTFSETVEHDLTPLPHFPVAEIAEKREGRVLIGHKTSANAAGPVVSF
jgi:hypothetical protein